MERPAAVVGVAGVFFLAAAYLVTIGLVMLVDPGLISMAAGADLLAGLELAGPYMFLLTGTVAAIIGYGLLRLNNYARRAAILVAIAGLVLLIPVVSRSVADFRFRALASRGVGVEPDARHPIHHLQPAGMAGFAGADGRLPRSAKGVRGKRSPRWVHARRPARHGRFESGA